MGKTLVIGASTKKWRFSNQAAHLLKAKGEEVFLLGVDDGEIEDTPILIGYPLLREIDTVTMYLRPDKQSQYYEYILGLKPQRIIFNPGAENSELAMLAEDQGILVENACTLIMLRSDAYDQF